MNAKQKQFISQNSIWLVLVALIVVVTIMTGGKFIKLANIETLLTNESIKGIMAFGVMMAILSKGIDLNPGSMAALVAVIGASMCTMNETTASIINNGGKPMPAIVAIVLCLALGCLSGAIFGSIIAYTKMPAFIATLGAQLMCRAAAKIITTAPVSNLSDGFRFLGKAKLGPIPMIVVVFIIMYIISAILLTQTRWGKSVYAVGGNDQAARVAGINVEKTLILVYVWCSFCAALGGILLAGRTGSADPSTYGLNYELDAIAAATVGGTSHTGGVCRISGVLAGILILGVVNNGLVMLGVNDNYTNIIKGLIIIVSVALDMRKNTKKV